MEVPRGRVRAPGGAYELYREFRTSRRALNVLSVRAGLPEQESSYAPPGARPAPEGHLSCKNCRKIKSEVSGVLYREFQKS